ncbi:LamG-like jellyroll fold domain-containing protein [Kiritimatiella glycovorans]|uniref:LamG-like jellyroll fold domain-containing protein n=1 Tax=Kiritimatiella glycovorans TaxID=1307763 RepID=UPI001364CF12|nr:LamG-like jellyroll fold domain-containing protein [Kiritimatiella glycovorans]
MIKTTKRNLLAAALVAAGMMTTVNAAETTPKLELGGERLKPGAVLELTDGVPDWRELFRADFTLHTRVKPDGDRFGDGIMFSWRSLENRLHMGALLGCQPINRDSFRMLYFFIDMPKGDVTGMTSRQIAGNSRRGYIGVPLWPEIEPINEKGWHDIIVRTQGNFIEIFIDGVVRAKKNVAASPRVQANTMFPRTVYADRSWTAVGGEADGRLPFPGEIDGFRAWDRALSDDEIKELSGGVFQGNYDRPFGWNQLGLFPNDWSYEKRKEWIDQQCLRMQRELIANEPFYPRFHPTFVTDTYNHMTIHAKGKTHLVPYFGFGYWNSFPIWDNWAFGHLVSDDGVRWKTVEQIWKLPSLNGTLYEEKKTGEVLGLLGWAGPDFQRFSLDRKMNVIRAEDDDLLKWSQHERSPLNVYEPEGWVGQDCDIFEQDGAYYMVAACKSFHGDPEKRSDIHLYRSDNLLDWEYVGLFYSGSNEGYGTEALHIFPIEDKLVMTGCHRIDLDAGYLIGTMRDGRFVPDVPLGERNGLFRFNYESPAERKTLPPTVWTVVDAKGRHVANQWLWFNAYSRKYGVRESMRRGWNGSSYSLSQEVKLLSDGSVGLFPLPEYAELRKPDSHRSTSGLNDGKSETLTGPAWLDLVAKWNGEGESVTLVLSKGGKDEVRIVYEDGKGVRLAPSAGSPAFIRNRDFVPVAFDDADKEIRVFLDGLFTEVYVAGRFFGFKWHNEAPGEVTARFEKIGGTAELESLDLWEMGSCWVK